MVAIRCESIREALDDTDVAVLVAYANNGMNVNRAAKSAHYDRRTVSSRLTSIRLRVGIDPRDFWGLNTLMKILKGGAYAERD